jgi:hypothetical protein
MNAEHVSQDIWKYHDAISPELCAEIISRFEADARRAYRNDVNSKEKFDNREGKMLFISDLPEWKDLDERIFAAVSAIFQHQFQQYHFAAEFKDEGYDVGCYFPPGEGCAEHFDSGNRSSRMASLVIYLNDVEEGGETVFPRQQIVIRPKRGMGILFPPHYTHPHHAIPPLTGPRYFLVTWANSQT